MRRFGVFDAPTLLGAILLVVFVCYAFLNPSSYLTTGLGYLLYVGIPAVGVLAALGVLMLPRNLRVQVYVVGWSVVVALYAFEGYLSWQEGRVVSLPSGWDTRTRLEVIKDLREKGVEAYPSVTPKNFSDTDLHLEIAGRDLVPLGGVPNAKVVHCNEAGQWAIYRSDRFGFSNPDEVWDQEPAVALIGDSYVQGACVPPDQTIAANLRLMGITTLNLGAQGNGPLGELATLREYAALKRPPFVIWFFYSNDLSQDLFRELTDPVISSYLDPSYRQGLIEVASQIDERLPGLVSALYEKALLAGRSRAMGGAPGDEHAEARDQAHFRRRNPLNSMRFLTLGRTRQRLGLFQAGADFLPPDEERFRMVLSQASKEVAAWGGNLYFVALPSWARALGAADPVDDESHEAGVRAAKEAGLETLDLTQQFRNNSDTAALFANRQPNHYSPLGYQFVAQAISARWLSPVRPQ